MNDCNHGIPYDRWCSKCDAQAMRDLPFHLQPHATMNTEATIKEQVNANAGRVLQERESSPMQDQIERLDRLVETAADSFHSLQMKLTPIVAGESGIPESPPSPVQEEGAPLVATLDRINERLGNIIEAFSALHDRTAL